MNRLALTFDDGPDRRFTAPLLDLLASIGARATFFVIARRAARCPGLIARMLADGQSVQLHCDQHVRHSRASREWVRADTERALARLRALGVAPRLWRTPWGDTAPWTAELAREQGLELVGWTVDSHDWRGDSAAEMLAACRPGLRAGAILLAHDGIGPGARRTDARQTLALVELVARDAAQRGLALGAL
ncbi:MAG: polysaccharide deacetylase family protein [Solirubrobacteraceae bacterium]